MGTEVNVKIQRSNFPVLRESEKCIKKRRNRGKKSWGIRTVSDRKALVKLEGTGAPY